MNRITATADELRAMLMSGMSLHDIAEHFGVSKQAVQQRAAKFGIAERPARDVKRLQIVRVRWPQDVRWVVTALRQAGHVVDWRRNNGATRRLIIDGVSVVVHSPRSPITPHPWYPNSRYWPLSDSRKRVDAIVQVIASSWVAVFPRGHWGKPRSFVPVAEVMRWPTDPVTAWRQFVAARDEERAA